MTPTAMQRSKRSPGRRNGRRGQLLLLITVLLAGCGGSSSSSSNAPPTSAGQTKATAVAFPHGSWQPSAPDPPYNAAATKAAGGDGFLGDDDAALGRTFASDQRFGRCIRKQIGIVADSRVVALLAALQRKDADAELAAAKAVGVCGVMKGTHDPSYDAPIGPGNL